MHLAITGGRREWHRVEVGPGNQLARLQGLRPKPVSPHAGGRHLADLLGGGERQAIRRVAVLLDLGRQGTAASRLILHIERLAHLGHGGLGKTGPVHGRVGQRMFIAEQIAVLDEQQRLDHQRRDGGKVRIIVGRILELIEGFRPAIMQGQTGLDLLGIGDEEAAAGVVIQGIGEMHLLADLIAALQQTLLHHGQQHITQPLVEGAILGEGNLLAKTGLDLIGQLGGIAGDLLRLQARRLHLIAHQSNHGCQAQ